MSAAAPTGTPVVPEAPAPPAPRVPAVRRGAALTISLAAWLLVCASTGLLLLARPPLSADLLFFVVDVTVAGVYGTLTAVILARRSHPVAWLLGLAALGGGVAAFAFAYQAWASLAGGPQVEAIARLNSIAWVPGTLALYLVVPWLVRDHALGREWLGVLAGAVVTLGATVAAVVGRDERGWWLAASVPVGLAAAAALEARRRWGPPAERNGLGWLALGTATLAVSFVPVVARDLPVPFWVTPLLHLLSQAVFPAAILVVVLRNRLWGLGLVVSRTLLAALLTTALVALYLLLTLLLSRLLPGEGVAHLLAAAAVVVAVQPARILLTRRVHLLVYGDAADQGRAVRRLGTQLQGPGSVEELLAGLAEDLGRSVRLESVVVSATGPAARLEVRWGSPTGPPETVELRHRGEPVGRLVVTPRPGEALSARDRATLASLGSVIAASLAVARTAADLRAARERLSRARLEERRVIRREIHDGLGPSLAGIRLGLQGARNLLGTDPAASRALLDRLQDEVDAATLGVRTLSHHLLPPVLDELGLGAALSELVARRAEAGEGPGTLRTRLTTENLESLDGLDPRLAAAAYAVAGEALANAARHSGARSCQITARRLDGCLEVVVTDDGRGIAEDAVPGVGSASMRERAAELGGEVTVTSGPRGTTVRLVLPEVGHGR